MWIHFTKLLFIILSIAIKHINHSPQIAMKFIDLQGYFLWPYLFEEGCYYFNIHREEATR